MDFNVEHSPRYRLAMLARLWLASTEKIYERDYGVSLAEWRIIAIVGTEQPINAGAIADRGLLKKAHISRLVAGLIRRGLMEGKVDGQDARKIWLTLSETGFDLYRRIARASLERDVLFLKPLGAEERVQLDRLLTRLIADAATGTKVEG